MKKIFILPTLLCFAMICSCQKQDSTAESQLPQRNTDLDARQETLDERVAALDEKVRALDEKVNVLVEKEKSMANARPIPNDSQREEPPDPAQIEAEKERIQQFAAEMRSMIPDNSKVKAEKEMARRRSLEELQRQGPPKAKTSVGAIFPAPQATLPTSSSALETTTPASASSEAEIASPTPSPTP